MAWLGKQWQGSRNPDIDILVPGLNRGAGRSADRLRLSAGTRDKDEYDRRVATLKRLGERMLFEPLRALYDEQVTLVELLTAAEAGPAALAQLKDRVERVALGELAKRYWNQHVDGAGVQQKLERFLAFLGKGATVADLTAANINRFLETLTSVGVRANGEPASGATKNRYRATVQGFCSWLVAQQQMVVSPYFIRKAVKRYAEPRGERLPEFEPDEFTAYLEAIGDGSYQTLLWTHMETGADAGELHEHLTVRQCRFAKDKDGVSYLRFKRTKTGERAHEREIPITPDLAAALQEHIREHGLRGDDLVFGMLDYWKSYKVHKAAAKSIGRKQVSRKDLRHVAAIRWRRLGYDLEQIREWLDHTSIEQTRVYAAFKSDDRFHAPMIAKLSQTYKAPLKLVG